MKHISFLTLFLCIFINAQNFKPAIITLNNNVKETGNVIFNNPSSTQQLFEFKDNTGQLKKLGLKDIREVNIINNTKFLKAEIEISRHAENLQYLELNKDFNIKKEEHFIEQIVFGKYSLYKYSDNMNKAYFYSSADSDGIKPLLFKEYFIENGNKASNKDYLKVLEKIDCGNTNFNNVDYLESSLTSYFNKINQCYGDINTNFQKAKGYVDHKVYGLYSNIKNTDNSGFGAGYEFEYHIPFNNYGFSFAAAPGFIIYNKKQNPAVYSLSYNSIISLPLILRYYPVKTDEFKLYVSYSVMNLSQLNETFINFDKSEEKTSNFTVFYNNFFELGLRFKTFEAFARFHSRSAENAISLGLKYNIYSNKK